MPKIVITAVYAFEPDMDTYPYYLCNTIENVQRYLSMKNNALNAVVQGIFEKGDFSRIDCRVEIDRSDEG